MKEWMMPGKLVDLQIVCSLTYLLSKVRKMLKLSRSVRLFLACVHYVVYLCPLCSYVKNRLYMRNRGEGRKKTRVRNLSERALTIEIVWALRLMK